MAQAPVLSDQDASASDREIKREHSHMKPRPIKTHIVAFDLMLICKSHIKTIGIVAKAQSEITEITETVQLRHTQNLFGDHTAMVFSDSHLRPLRPTLSSQKRVPKFLHW